MCWNGAALVAVEPAHVMRSVLLLMLAASKDVAILVVDADASALLTQRWCDRSLSAWSTT